jgi:GcrA cell cycle regulator
MSWTPERIDELTKLWESGQSASVIGKLLGVSKNAVVGKAHRMKLQARPSPIKRGEDGDTAGPVVKAPARERQVAARPAPSDTQSAGSGGRGAAGSEPLQTVISAALAAKAAGPKAPAAAASGRSSPAASGAKAVSSARAARNGTRDSVASATRAVHASRRGPQCLWPIGDPGDDDFHFCGEPAQAGKPYCSEHCARAYITRSRSDSAAA